MTRATGWLGNGEPDGQDPGPQRPPGFADFILQHRPPPGQGRTLEQVLDPPAHRTGWYGEEPEREDPDDRASRMITQGYSPGMLRSLSEQLGDVEAALADERAKVEASARRAEYLRRAHEAGRLTAWQVMERLDVDGGDETRVALLERKRDALRARLDEATEMIAPPERRQLDGVEAAVARARDAHREYVELTRQRMAEAEARRPAPRPFSAGRGGTAVRSDQPVTCAECVKVGASAAESFLLHADPSPEPAPAVPGEDERDWLSSLGETAGRRACEGTVISR